MKLGIALSGGGIKGIAHAGVLKALEDNGIKIDIIGGTSSGSLVASSYAMGYSPEQIHKLFKENANSIVKINRFPILQGIGSFIKKRPITLKGLNNGNNIEKIYNKIADKKGIKNINEIKMPLVIPTVDIITETEYIFTNKLPQNINKKNNYITDITIGKAVRASSSFSAVFSPCKYESYAFIDGGALNNVPVDEVKKQGADKIIAVKFAPDVIDEESNIMDIAMKTIDIMGNKICEKSVEKSDVIINISTNKTGLLDTKRLDECFEAGYNSVIQNIDKIKNTIFEKQ